MIEARRVIELEDIPKKYPVMISESGLVPLKKVAESEIPKGAIFIMDDHGHARKVWELARLQGLINSGSTLLHIDKHDDLGFKNYYCDQPKSTAEILSLSDQCGSFIVPCMMNGLLGRTYWVCPKSDCEVKNQDELFYGGFVAQIPELEGGKNVLEEPYHVLIRNSIPKLNGTPVLVDIDLDYLNHYTDSPLGNFRLTERIRDFISELKEKTNPILTTIAISTGWTIAERRSQFLKAVLESLTRLPY